MEPVEKEGVDQTDEHEAVRTGTRLVIPRTWKGYPWFAWLAAAIYAFIFFQIFSSYL